MEMLPTQFIGTFKTVAGIMGVTDEDAEKGFEEINIGLMRMSLEAAHAESQGIGLKDVVHMADSFPLMSLVHICLKDVLSLNVPIEMVPLARKAQDFISQSIQVEDVQFELAKLACTSPRNSPHRALARFALFEAVRLNLLVASYLDRPALASADIDDRDLSQIAEEQVLKLIEEQSEVFESIYGPMRPLHMIVASALTKLTEKLDVFAKGIAVSEYVNELAEQRAEMERRLNQLPPQDELLVRNWAAPAFGEQQLTIEHLMRKHPLVFDEKASPEALEQRLSRARKRIGKNIGASPSRNRTTMIDLITSQENEQ